ncbi:hypothetical protein F5Y15DRAFT_421547 [Xylariaceae sp. FL0016]|nr:hypothetical protein F5Y15DRAFT_421547 [Xylariaceae sp. FL0016]
MANPHPIQPPLEEHIFHRRDAVKSAINGALIGGGVGFCASAVQNSLAKSNIGAWGVFTRTGSTMAQFAAVGTVYKFSLNATANLREKDDYLNSSVAGFLGGATSGLQSARIPRILGNGAIFSVILTAFAYTGGSLRGGRRGEVSELDEYERKEIMRKNRRRPIEETIMDVGEGRDIKPPGYEERRRERLKEKYGVDINPVSATVD